MGLGAVGTYSIRLRFVHEEQPFADLGTVASKVSEPPLKAAPHTVTLIELRSGLKVRWLMPGSCDAAMHAATGLSCLFGKRCAEH